MAGNRKSLLFKVIFWSFWVLIAAYLFPFFFQIFDLQGVEVGEDNFVITISRTILFAISSSLLLVICSYGIALLLDKVEIDSRSGNLLSLALLPIILGNVTTAYIFKSLLADTQLFASTLRSGPNTNYFVLALIQLWQFGFLFAYVFWLNHKAINKNRLEFIESAKAGDIRRLKDIYLPSSKNLIILLLLVGFIYNIYEEAKAFYIFKFSQGTNTELINHWLFRTYQSELVINSSRATLRLLTFSLLVFLVVFSTAYLLMFFMRICIDWISRISHTNTAFEFFKRYLGNITVVFLTLTLIFPVGYALVISTPTFDFELSFLLYPLALTVVVSLIATFLAILISISFRQLFSSTFSSFNNASSITMTLIFSLLLIPPIVIMLCGYKWNAYLLNLGSNSTILVWIIAHVILLLPLLIAFLIVIHFTISNNELEYLHVYSHRPSELLNLNYLKRFGGQYLLTFFFSTGIVWNEDTINKMLSDYIPSFANGLEMMISGKSADVSRASGYLFVSLSISIICVLLWQYLFNKNRKNVRR